MSAGSSQSSLVLELQRDIINDEMNVSAIALKALAISRKLKQSALVDWLELELNGYDGSERPIPRYRSVQVRAMFYNPLRGWCPIIFQDQNERDVMSRMPVSQALGQIESLVLDEKNNNLSMTYPAEIENTLRQGIGFDVDIKGFVSLASARGILDVVKKTILDWLLELESAGVLGDGMAFSEQEKRAAASPTTHIVAHNVGVIATSTDQSTQNISVSQTIEAARIQSLIESVKPTLQHLPTEAAEEIQRQLQIAKTQAESGNPQSSRGALAAAKRVAEGVAGNVVAAGIVQLIVSLLS